MQVIYADVLVATNVLVDYLLLRASAAVMSVRVKPWRLLAASVIGGAYSLVIFVQLPVAAAAALKIAAVAAMVAAAFGVGTPRGFFRSTAVFLLANLVFAGLMLALWYKLLPNSMLYKNGAVYFDVDVLTLVISAAVCYAALTLLSFLARRRTQRGNVFSVELVCNGKKARGRALFDTGNSLRESFSGRPAVIAEAGFVKNIQPPGFRDLMNASTEKPLDFKGFRMIPFATLNRSGALPSFRADEIRVFAEGKWSTVENIYVAVSEKKFTASEFDVLLGVPVFDAIDSEAAHSRKERRELKPARRGGFDNRGI